MVDSVFSRKMANWPCLRRLGVYNGNMTHRDQLRQQIRQAREDAGMTQKTAAAKYGCTRTIWCQWETGSKPPSANVLEKMAAVVGLEISVQTQEAKGKKTWQPRKSD